eukprot:TRINITY_DN2530_c0_g1_i2.p1 TRINITY_DN2530_c0_g1~~TRINITY_DN2530_c0_g1_i2.p1  ORF type:complete len:117 (-),score=3.31 TRINITY_DN2530_c0_g1_i2:36-386(-)
MNKDPDILYDDPYVTINKSCGVTIKWYYFPIAASKTIPWNHVLSVHRAEQLNLSILDYKHWGMGLSSIWWACDMNRNEVTSVVLYTNSIFQKGFSTRDPVTVTNIIREYQCGQPEK